MTPQDERRVRAALRTAWSEESSFLFASENPAAGQCGVTAALIARRYGGVVEKTRVGSAWHFYNRFGPRRIDFTAVQFVEVPV